ncbi:MAG: diadenylate cyclase CdaA [Lentisphaeria bacterium]|nr:diadenylate cyclase CdaA [Lentisphaeria bacterium]
MNSDGFLNLYNTIIPLLEILTIAIFIYFLLYYLRRTRAVFVLSGMFLLLVCTILLFKLLNFSTLYNLLRELWIVFAFAAIVIFQSEIRQGFAKLGTSLFIFKGQQKEAIHEIVQACCAMADQKCGALIVIEGKIQMEAIIDEAIKLDNPVQAIVLESIFYPKAPLHDGAVIIRNNRIVAARAILPLGHNENISKRWGTRHRAAVGITDESDAVALVVSEESGTISIAVRGFMWKNIPQDKLYAVLNLMLVEKGSDYAISQLLGRV